MNMSGESVCYNSNRYIRNNAKSHNKSFKKRIHSDLQLCVHSHDRCIIMKINLKINSTKRCLKKYIRFQVTSIKVSPEKCVKM